MSYDENKISGKKNGQKSPKSKANKKCKSEEIKRENEIQSDNKSKNKSEQQSTNSQYINPKDNIDNLNELKKNLNEENKYFDKYINALENYELDNNNVKLCYETEENMNKYVEGKLMTKKDAFKLDNDLFELQAKRIFSKVYELKEKILYPYFSVEYSKGKRTNTIKIYFYQIEIKSENNRPICFTFPEIKNNFIINFEKKPIIIEKKGNNNFVMSVISKDFNHSIDFHFTKMGDFFQTSLIYADINDELFQIEENVKKTKNKIDSLKNIRTNKKIENNIGENEGNINNKIDKIPQEINTMNNNEENPKEKQINNKNTQENIQEKDMNNNKGDKENLQMELIPNKENYNEILNNNTKDNIDNNNSIQKSSEKEILKKKLKIYEIKLKHIKEKFSKENITKELAKKNEELEILNLEIEIDENKDDSEAKKNALIKEIEEYEKLLKPITVTIRKLDQEFDGLYINKKEFVLKNDLGYEMKIPANSFVIVEVKNHNNYFDLSLNLEKKEKILKSIGFPIDKFFFVGILRSVDKERKEKGKLRKLKNKNMIIIYPDETTFLGVSLFDEIIDKNGKEEKAQSTEDKSSKNFQDEVIQMFRNLSNEIKEIKNNMNIMGNKISDMDNKIGTMGKDIDYLKNKINK
jgi:hypothetical protein